eukprot:scaffold10183_cov115-Skeletonema_marinoi.AAC.4
MTEKAKTYQPAATDNDYVALSSSHCVLVVPKSVATHQKIFLRSSFCIAAIYQPTPNANIIHENINTTTA